MFQQQKKIKKVKKKKEVKFLEKLNVGREGKRRPRTVAAVFELKGVRRRRKKKN